jgi:hypothetical protein
MRTIVQYELLSVSYAQIDHVEMRGAGPRRRKRLVRCAGEQSAEEIPRVTASVQ